MKEPKDKRNRLLALLVVLGALALGVVVGALLFSRSAPLPPDRAPERDPNAVPYEEATSQGGGGGGSVTLRYQATAEIDLAAGSVSLVFVDPPSSDQGMVIQLLIQGEVLAESGLLPPGSALYALELLPGAAERLQPGDYDGSFLVSYYDPESGQRSALQTEAKITVTVRDGE